MEYNIDNKEYIDNIDELYSDIDSLGSQLEEEDYI